MNIRQADPDLESIARRLLQNEIDLQPDFQRQEVWSKSKKQKLIDTILRGWAVPPIHLVQNNEIEEVLDGQQRLTAIRDFFSEKFSVDGLIPPESDSIKELHGFYYRALPERVRRKFDRYTLRIYTLTDALPLETAELFYRLNQPTALTSGEQRNALHGFRRSQMKNIVNQMLENNFSARTIGFSNSRLSYDDVIARTLVVLERNTLRSKIGEGEISDAFRIDKPFDEILCHRVSVAVETVNRAVSVTPLKLNKASLFSFLVFISRTTTSHLPNFHILVLAMSKQGAHVAEEYGIPDVYRELFLDRAASRVTDISSVVLRDFCIAKCLSFIDRVANLVDQEQEIMARVTDLESNFDGWTDEDDLSELIMDSAWGQKI